MSAVVREDDLAVNDGYYLTPDKAKDKRRIASVRAKNAANARVFVVGGAPMTVKQIASEVHLSASAVSKEIKRLRGRGLRRFTLSDFTHRDAANDDDHPGVQSNDH